MAVITLTREQLYERLWQTPTVHLCKEFGLSDVGLAKLCKRYKIPKPYLGYWARKTAGGKPKVTPLPLCSDSSLATIQFAQPEPTVQESEFFDPEIEALCQKELQRERLVVPASLRSPLPIVARTKEALHSGKWPDEPTLHVSVSKPLIDRAMRIMNALLKGLLARGYSIENEGRYHSNASVIRGYGHEFGIRIREPSVMVQRMDTFYHRMRTEYDPSGRIQLEVEGFGSWAPKVVRDGKRSTIEDRIGDLPAQMLKAIDAARRKKAEWEAEERRREAERQAKWEVEGRRLRSARYLGRATAGPGP